MTKKIYFAQKNNPIKGDWSLKIQEEAIRDFVHEVPMVPLVPMVPMVPMVPQIKQVA